MKAWDGTDVTCVHLALGQGIGSCTWCEVPPMPVLEPRSPTHDDNCRCVLTERFWMALLGQEIVALHELTAANVPDCPECSVSFIMNLGSGFAAMPCVPHYRRYQGRRSNARVTPA